MATEQVTFRARNDDGSETGATWKEALDTDWYQAAGVNFRVRFGIWTDADFTSDWQLHYSINGTPWERVSGLSTSAVRPAATPHFVDGAATTQQLTVGTFTPGTVDENSGFMSSYTVAANSFTELEWCLRLGAAASVPTYVAGADTGYASSSSQSVNLPAGIQAGDIIVAQLHIESNPGAVTGPSGWALVPNTRTINPLGDNRIEVWWKRATGTEGGTAPVWTFSTTVACAKQSYVYRGALASGDPWAGSGCTAADTWNRAASITYTGTHDGLGLYFYNDWADTIAGRVAPSGYTINRGPQAPASMFGASKTVAAGSVATGAGATFSPSTKGAAAAATLRGAVTGVAVPDGTEVELRVQRGPGGGSSGYAPLTSYTRLPTVTVGAPGSTGSSVPTLAGAGTLTAGQRALASSPAALSGAGTLAATGVTGTPPPPPPPPEPPAPPAPTGIVLIPPVRPPGTGWRYLAKQVLGGQWLDLDLPLKRDELRWDLSAAGVLRARVAPEYGQLRWADGLPVLGEWATELYAERDGRIEWGGILQKSSFRGAEWSLEAYGFTSYPNGTPYLDVAIGPSPSVDPTQIFALIWSRLQALPDGDLGVQVVRPTPCPVRLGSAEEPYEVTWHEAVDSGQELSRLAEETPFDFTESHAWGSGGTVSHRVTVHYPRAGRRRTDLVFNADNLAAVLEPDRDGGEFANALYVFGKGEGGKMIHDESVVRDGRLRRAAVHVDKMIGTTARAGALAHRERRRRGLALSLESVVVKDHPNAPLGSWSLGDDISLAATLPHTGPVSLAHRITGWSLGPSDDRATLHLQRSETFRYGAPA